MRSDDELQHVLPLDATLQLDPDPGFAQLKLRIDRLTTDPGEGERVDQHLEEIEAADAAYQVGCAAHSAGDYDAAEQQLRRAALGGHPEAAYELAVLLVERGSGSISGARDHERMREAAAWLLEAVNAGAIALEDLEEDLQRLRWIAPRLVAYGNNEVEEVARQGSPTQPAEFDVNRPEPDTRATPAATRARCFAAFGGPVERNPAAVPPGSVHCYIDYSARAVTDLLSDELVSKTHLLIGGESGLKSRPLRALKKEEPMTVELPERGFVFWPVGCGDSTTIKVNDNVVMQVDIQHHESAEDDDEPYHPVVDTLVDEVLPEVDGEKYLAVFALSHPDKDHCKGFAELLKRCKIGELWFSPRIRREYDTDEGLSDDAQKFCDEVNRRIGLNQGEEAESGDRIRIIGNDDILDEEDYKDIPDDRKSRPGESTTVLDGVNLDGTFRAFFHAPFGDDSDGPERNNTSLAMQITLTEGEGEGRLMLFGDLDYPPLKRIFEKSKDEDKAWDVFLAPHHCSKSAMYFQEGGDSDAVLKQDILDMIEAAAGKDGWVVSSSTKVPASNSEGDNPPHAKAKARYEEIAPSGFLCTGDDADSDDPISFEVTLDGIALFSGEADTGKSEASTAIKDARGGSEPTGTTVGFGRR